MNNKLKLFLMFALSISLTGCEDNSMVFDSEMYESEQEINTHFHSDVKKYSSSNVQLDNSIKDFYFNQTSQITKEDITYGEIYVNGNKKESIDATYSGFDDAYLMFYGANKARVVSRANGYALTLPTNTIIKPNFDASEYRAQYETLDYKLTVSIENENPYGNWKTYHNEWLTKYLVADGEVTKEHSIKLFFRENKLSYTRDPIIKTDLLANNEVELISILINDNENVEMPYYNIAIIKQPKEIKHFTLMVMKSKKDMSTEFDNIISSYSKFSAHGKVQNKKDFELKVPTYWSKETQKYYKKMLEQKYTDWGVFNRSMNTDNSSTKRISEMNQQFESWFDYKMDIMPTYTHIGEVDDTEGFPLQAANYLAGGNGFNDKPVIQFTMQFTVNNNSALYGYTPMYDIIRGHYDEYFKELALQMKEYGKPILFRLNNEMNSDWVSYCAMVTLLDPDIFVMTWERMAKIFVENGANNVMFIFNPTHKTYPYCSWGEDLCYLPSLKYVHFLGLTAYEYNNYESNESFASLYRNLYDKNSPQWDKYPAIISEFGCGSGGNYEPSIGSQLYRNAKSQAIWVEQMFYALNYFRDEPFIDQIKGAIWFNANDEVGSYVKNMLVIDDVHTPHTIQAFKQGLAETKKIKE